MDIYISADHNGFELKNTLRDWLVAEGHTVSDLGPETLDPDDDYPDYAIKVAQAVAENPDERFGIAICGSGVGMAVMADKVKGVRAGLIHDPEIARSARSDDDINVLALGARYITNDQAKEVVAAWLSEEFSGADRHKRRIGKIKEFEDTNLCP